MKSLLLIGAIFFSLNLFSQNDFFTWNQVQNPSTKEAEFQLMFTHDGTAHKVEGFVSKNKQSSQILELEYAEYQIPPDAIAVIRNEFENGNGGTELVAYCVRKDNRLLVYGKTSIYPNWDQEVFSFEQKLAINSSGQVTSGTASKQAIETGKPTITAKFDPKSFAKNYTEKLSSTDLTALNALAKKWHNAVLSGSYETYKSITPKELQMTLENFMKYNTEFNKNKSKMTFQNGNKHVITDVAVLLSKAKTYDALKSSGCDVKNAVVLYNNYLDNGKEDNDGGFIFIKENGVWKTAGWSKNMRKDEEELKGLRVLSKEKVKACDCIDKVMSGDTYEAQKCQFIMVQFRANTFEEFFACFNTTDYCAYRSKLKEMNLGDPLRYTGLSSENEEKQKSLGKRCQ